MESEERESDKVREGERGKVGSSYSIKRELEQRICDELKRCEG